MGPGWQGVFTLKLPNVWEFRAAQVAVRKVINTPEGCSGAIFRLSGHVEMLLGNIFSCRGVAWSSPGSGGRCPGGASSRFWHEL